MKILKRFYTVAELAAAAVFVYLLAYPAKAAESTLHALEFCGRVLFPSLFVYTVLAKRLFGSAIARRAAGAVGCNAFVYAAGLLCGPPLGAALSRELYESGAYDKKQAEYLACFTNNVSLSFCIGFVGRLFGTGCGLRLAVYQLVGSLAAAFVMKRVMFGAGRCTPGAAVRVRSVALRTAISDGFSAMLNVCACAVFFGALGEALVGDGSAARVLLRGVFEFSSGCAAAAGGRYGFALCAAAVGHCGLSAAMQVRFALGSGLSVKPYLVSKCVGGAVITLLAVIFG